MRIKSNGVDSIGIERNSTLLLACGASGSGPGLIQVV